MLLSLALIFILSIILGKILELIKLPTLLGMLATGIILGPQLLNLIDSSVLDISAQLRQIALVVILLRAGFNLNINELKENGRSSVLLSFVPACFEIIAVVVLAPLFFSVSYLEAGIIGTVLAAVSPAVIVPRMIGFIEKKIGTKKCIPQMILAGASLDDIVVMVIFSSLISVATSDIFSPIGLLKLPISIILGVILGVSVSILLKFIFKKVKLRDSLKIIILMSFSFLLISLESSITGIFNFSALLAIMSLAMFLRNKKPDLSTRLSSKLSKIWTLAEILLFSLVGATVNLSYAVSLGFLPIIFIFIVLSTRLLGVYISLIKSKLNKKEKLFCCFSYIPKATVQAAIGSIPLSLGLACGDIVLTISVLSIIITAPLGAILIDKTHKKLLK